MKHNYASEWFQFADSDLASAEYLQGMHPQPMEIICYLCEQSAEKYLKGYLIFMGAYSLPKTHNLVFLCEKCSDFDDQFYSILEVCSVLTRYGVQPRYPQEMEIHEHDMQQALSYARQIRDFGALANARHEASQR